MHAWHCLCLKLHHGTSVFEMLASLHRCFLPVLSPQVCCRRSGRIYPSDQAGPSHPKWPGTPQRLPSPGVCFTALDAARSVVLPSPGGQTKAFTKNRSLANQDPKQCFAIVQCCLNSAYAPCIHPECDNCSELLQGCSYHVPIWMILHPLKNRPF